MKLALNMCVLSIWILAHQSPISTEHSLSVSFCNYKNQAKWGRLETCILTSPPIWQYDFTKGAFSFRKKPLFDLYITGFAQKCFNRMLEKWGFWQSYLPFKYLVLVLFNETISHFLKIILKMYVFFDFYGENRQIIRSVCFWHACFWFFLFCLNLTNTCTNFLLYSYIICTFDIVLCMDIKKCM